MEHVTLPPNLSALPIEDRKGNVPERGLASVRPATRWQDAHICGNGTVEAKVFGNPNQEIILIRHEKMVIPELPDGWIHPPEPPEIAHVLPEIRELLMAGNFKAANETSVRSIREAGYPTRIPNNKRCEGFALVISREPAVKINEYIRTLDFLSGESVTTFRDGFGPWKRSCIVSRPDGVAAMRLSIPAQYKGSVTFSIEVPSVITPSGTGEYAPRRKVSDPGMDITTVYRNDEIFITGSGVVASLGDYGFSGLIRFYADNGTVKCHADRLEFTGCAEITLVAAIEWGLPTGDDNAKDIGAMPGLLNTVGEDYAGISDKHRDWQSQLFSRTSLDLASTSERMLSTEELQVEQHLSSGFSPALLEKVFDMGRYFYFYSHGEVPYIWGHVNINVNLQIASGIQANLLEMMESYFTWIESMAGQWRRNAENIFGFRGFLSSVHPDGLNGILFHTTPLSPHHYWIAGAGWCYQPFWEYYQATGDLAFARDRMYKPLLEIARFFDDYLTVKDSNGKYVFVPSYSPENWPGNLDQTQCITINSAMDISVCREVLSHLLELCEVLEREDPAIPRWREILDSLPDYLTDDLGALKEWAWPGLPERFDHRHLSHLYGVWPGDEIRHDIHPDLANAAMLANRKRAQGNASIHGIMHRALVAARLGDSFLSTRNLRQVLDQGYLNSGSMMTNHNPYRTYCPDACGSLPVLLIEMLVYSRPGVIDLLPAAPAELPAGLIRGIYSRSAALITELKWDPAAGNVEINLVSLIDQQIEIRIHGKKTERIDMAQDQKVVRKYSFKTP